MLNRLPEEAAKIAAAVNAAAPAAATEGAPLSGAVATEAAGTRIRRVLEARRVEEGLSGKTSSAKSASRTSNHHYRRKGR